MKFPFIVYCEAKDEFILVTKVNYIGVLKDRRRIIGYYLNKPHRGELYFVGHNMIHLDNMKVLYPDKLVNKVL